MRETFRFRVFCPKGNFDNGFISMNVTVRDYWLYLRLFLVQDGDGIRRKPLTVK